MQHRYKHGCFASDVLQLLTPVARIRHPNFCKRHLLHPNQERIRKTIGESRTLSRKRISDDAENTRQSTIFHSHVPSYAACFPYLMDTLCIVYSLQAMQRERITLGSGHFRLFWKKLDRLYSVHIYTDL